jgi:hypothetical protein
MSPEEVRAFAELAQAGTGHLDWGTYLGILCVSCGARQNQSGIT